jgi:hypothetical protein
VVVVVTEPAAEWLIEDVGAAAARVLADSGVARLVSTSELDLARRRKIWFFNGTDLLLALRALKMNRVFVRDGLDAVGLHLAASFSVLAAIALEDLARDKSIAGYDFSANRRYGDVAIERIRAQASRTDRVLRELGDLADLIPADSTPWLSKINQRITEPVLLGSAHIAEAGPAARASRIEGILAGEDETFGHLHAEEVAIAGISGLSLAS